MLSLTLDWPESGSGPSLTSTQSVATCLESIKRKQIGGILEQILVTQAKVLTLWGGIVFQASAECRSPGSLHDGWRSRIVAAALNHRRTVTVLLLLGEEEYGTLLPAGTVTRLRERLHNLRWFQNQSIPLAGLCGERSLNRFNLMDLALLVSAS